MKGEYKVGIDLGGTKIEAVLLKDNAELARKRIPTGQEKGYAAILAAIKSLYTEIILKTGGAEHTLGIGIPGTISKKTGLVKNANTVCLIGRPLKQDLEKTLGHPARIENDANCFTLAEAVSGAGKGKRVVFGVILGTGTGGGIAIDGKVHDGLQGIAGEWGHMQIDPKGPECYCGKRGCVETFISGGGLQKLYQEDRESSPRLLSPCRSGAKIPLPSGRRRGQERGYSKTVQEILREYRRGDKLAGKIFKEFFVHFGIALSNVIDVLDPDIVVIGGGLSNIKELYTLGVREVRRNIFSDSLETLILKNILGDSAGVLGAAEIGI